MVYGSCTVTAPTSTDKPQSGAYMYVWRKDARKGWQLLHESVNVSAKELPTKKKQGNQPCFLLENNAVKKSLCKKPDF